jgi:hypothetical protein
MEYRCSNCEQEIVPDQTDWLHDYQETSAFLICRPCLVLNEMHFSHSHNYNWWHVNCKHPKIQDNSMKKPGEVR